jgi:hypothetical protein
MWMGEPLPLTMAHHLGPPPLLLADLAMQDRDCAKALELRNALAVRSRLCAEVEASRESAQEWHCFSQSFAAEPPPSRVFLTPTTLPMAGDKGKGKADARFVNSPEPARGEPKLV